MSEKASGGNSTRELEIRHAEHGAPTSHAEQPRVAPQYRAPKLTRFGTLIELTQSGSGSVGETAVAKTRRPRPQS